MDIGLFLLRVTLGGVMAAHGSQKLFGWFGGYGIAGTGGWLASMGFRPGVMHARVVALSETVGGLLLILGMMTPFAAAAVLGVMIVAVVSMHWEKGFFNMAGGYEFNLLIAATSVALAFTGAGRWSLDSAMNLGLRGLGWGMFAISLGVIGAGIALSLREAVAQEVTADHEREETREAA